MIKLDTNIIAEWVHGTTKGHAFVDGVKVDNRVIEVNDLFVCLIGERVDGHTFAQAAVDAGAVCLIVDHVLDIDVCQIVVRDTMEALRDFGNAYRATLNAFFIGITGSNGKTSTKDMFYSVLSRVGPTIATYKNQNTEIGSYLNLFRMDASTQYAIMEMGLDFPNEVRVMAEIVKPDVAIVTSLAPAHIVNFEDLNHIAREKFTIFSGISKNENKYYQGDFEAYRLLDEGYISFGFNENNTYHVDHIVSDTKGVSFNVNGVGYHTNLLGEHQASNAAAVIAVCKDIGIDEAIIRGGLEHVELTSLRMELVPKEASLVLLDAYKSNPISTKFALRTLNSYDFKGPKYVILSDMVELGNESVYHHQDIVETLLQYQLDGVYLYGPEFKKALTLLEHVPKSFHLVEDFDELRKIAHTLFKNECMILIKGSRFYAMERLMEDD